MISLMFYIDVLFSSYLGMEKSGFDFWASLCSHDVHPVGWAASNDLIILPPRSIEKTQVSLTRDYTKGRLYPN